MVPALARFPSSYAISSPRPTAFLWADTYLGLQQLQAELSFPERRDRTTDGESNEIDIQSEDSGGNRGAYGARRLCGLARNGSSCRNGCGRRGRCGCGCSGGGPVGAVVGGVGGAYVGHETTGRSRPRRRPVVDSCLSEPYEPGRFARRSRPSTIAATTRARSTGSGALPRWMRSGNSSKSPAFR